MIRGWREDVEMQEKFTSDDQEMIHKFEDLLQRTNVRESRVGLVKDNLSTGIHLMNEYLGKMGNKNKTNPPVALVSQKIKEEAQDELVDQETSKDETNPNE